MNIKYIKKIFFSALLGLMPFTVMSNDLVGIDANENSIRDDVDAYLKTISTSDKKSNILREQAIILQKIMVLDLSKTNEVLSLGKVYMQNMDCLARAYSINGEDPKFMVLSRNITERTFDTTERNRKFHIFLGIIEKEENSSVLSNSNNCESL